MEIMIRDTCRHCKGERYFPNTDENTKESVPFDCCTWCRGTGTEQRFISIDELKIALGLKNA